jgi:hypothetical protein
MATKVPAFVAAFSVVLFLLFLAKLRDRSRRRSWRDHTIQVAAIVLFGYMVFCVVLMLQLPSTPVLRSFGLPKSPGDVANPKDVLRYLERYNEAIVSLTDTLYVMLFAGVFWVGPAFLAILFAARHPESESGSGIAVD